MTVNTVTTFEKKKKIRAFQESPKVKRSNDPSFFNHSQGRTGLKRLTPCPSVNLICGVANCNGVQNRTPSLCHSANDEQPAHSCDITTARCEVQLVGSTSKKRECTVVSRRGATGQTARSKKKGRPYKLRRKNETVSFRHEK